MRSVTRGTTVGSRKKKKVHPWAHRKQSAQWRKCKFKSCRAPHKESKFKGHCSINCQKRKQVRNDRGYQFDLGHSVRSGWERKYADWLRARGIQYFYEPKTFSLQGGLRYMPDFFLPSCRMVEFGVHMHDHNGDKVHNGSIWLDTWVEIKGYMGPKDREKIEKFRNTGRRLLVLDKIFFNSSYFKS